MENKQINKFKLYGASFGMSLELVTRRSSALIALFMAFSITLIKILWTVLVLAAGRDLFSRRQVGSLGETIRKVYHLKTPRSA